MAATLIALSAFTIGALAAAEPAVTAAAMLDPRQLAINPALVGYISVSDGYDNSRACDFPQVVSTSGSFAQCCPLSGACPFYTACSSNTLLAASGSAVPCDVNPGLTCNTAVLATTAGSDGGASYLACWQSTLGSSAFTFVQDIGSASVAAPASTTGSGSAVSTSASQASATDSDTASSTASQSSNGSSSSSSTTASRSSASSSVGSATESASSSASSANSTSGAGPATNGFGFKSVAVGAVALFTCFLF
ncbi:hypothetical protein Q7P35_001288 [Cladosporium inversicolor]